MKRSISPRRGEISGSPCYHGANKGSNSNTHIVVQSLAKHEATQIHTDSSSERSIEEGRPVATKLNAESAASETCTDGHLQGSIVARALGYLLKLVGILFDGVVFTNSFPREFADERDGSHVDTMLVATLKLRERVFIVAEIDHQHVVLHVDVQMLFGQSEEGCHAFHVPHNAVRVRCAFYKELSSAQQQVELVANELFSRKFGVCCH